ncbi:5'-AMP-activated protein kinase subunit beta-1 [Gracilariopsis chorda]|uniref:5'-AMP-activated protein kinase subunit beta-1 n=1 Tax=Gracilariopsis chorda TaxID=448386 RepID=A0A2V3IND9_9FLOR|nr:5'-AMP-activated protein kinase subunit beta-1 [Gracilariopsis chorda]|eukprot:PXF42640.1 5'-AMP-activated protein kinase subunit beta-1 [Gracilariopsis chorda]
MVKSDTKSRSAAASKKQSTTATPTPTKRTNKVVTGSPGSKPLSSSPKVDQNSTKPVKDAVNDIDTKLAKENTTPEKIDPLPPASAKATAVTDAKPLAERPNGNSAATPALKPSQVTLEWTPHTGSNVLVTGSFCDWKDKHTLSTADGKYQLTLPLPPGKHVYKFIVDGEWCYDITQPTETDSEGNVNNVLVV